MNCADAIAGLRVHADAVRAMGATSLYLFGSTAQGTARPGSDIDLYIDYDPTGSFNAFDLVGIQQFLESRMKAPIDLTTRDGLHPRLRDRIEQTALRVF